MLDQWRAAVRSIVRRRAFAATIVLTLTLGIGVNSAIFSAVDAVLLKPLPYPASDRLVSVYEANAQRNEITGLIAPARLQQWDRMNRSFDGLAGSYFENVTDTTGPLPERLAGMRTSPRFFSVLGVPAALGRTFTAAEEGFGGPAAVVLSDALWRRRFAGDRSVIGRTLLLGGRSYVIVGVMPPSFRYPSARTDVWLPAQTPPGLARARQARFYVGIGRLKPSVTMEQGRDDLRRVQADLATQFPATDAGWSVSVVPLKEEQVGGVRRSLWLLFGAVVLVLLAACGSVACMLLADAARREQEIAVRVALGAQRRTIVRELLVEGLVLSLAGAAGGLVVAYWGTAALRIGAAHLPRIAELRVDARLVLFTLALGVATTVVFGLVPALRASRRDVANRVASGTRGDRGRQRLQGGLVAAQITLAIVLLIGAGLLIRSLLRLQQTTPGFSANHVIAFRITAGWNERPADVAQRQLRTLERLRALPRVRSAALSSFLPAGADYPPAEFTIAGRDAGDRTFTQTRQVSADYFATLDIPVVQGSTCRDDVRVDAPRQIVVNRAFVERFFSGESPIGHRVRQQFPGEGEIIGVVADVRERGVSKPPEATTYYCGLLPTWPDPFYLVRSAPSGAATLVAIRQAVGEIEPRRAVYAAAPLTETLSESLSQPRLATILLASFAAAALLLAAIGLSGILAHFVSQRRREIGIRMAVGAGPNQVLGRVLLHGAAITGLGIAVGLAGALTGARVMAGLLFETRPHDPVTFVVVPLLLAGIAAAAALIPARRAARLDPMQVLREE